MKKIKDITLQEVKEGQKWRVHLPGDSHVPVEEWEIEAASSFTLNDHVAYSAIYVIDDGHVSALIQVKEVGDLDYGGEYCEYKNGKWQTLGLKPNPNAPHGTEFVANPLENDPSFDAPDHDYRKYHRDHFKKWIGKLR